MDHLGALQTAPRRRRRKSGLARRSTRLFPGVGTYVGRGKKGPADVLAALDECTFDSPTQISAPLRDGSLLVADERNGAIRRVQAGKGIISTVPTQPSTKQRGARQNQLQSPISIDNGQALMMLDRQHHKVVMMQFKPHTNSASRGQPSSSWSATPAEPTLKRSASKHGPPSFGPDNLRAGSDERVLCDVAGTGAAGHVNGAAARAQFKSPSHLALLADGSVLVSDTGNHVIRRISGRPGRTGLYVCTVAGRPCEAGFQDGAGSAAWLNAPMGLAVDADGCVLVADTKNHAVRLLVPPPPASPWDAPWGVRTVAGGRGLPDALPPPRSSAAKHSAKPQSGISTKMGSHQGSGAGADASTVGDTTSTATCGVAGYRDGSVASAMFKLPQGICLLHVPRSGYEAHVKGEYAAAEGGGAGGASSGRGSFMSDSRSVFSRGGRSRSGSASSRSPRSRSTSPKREASHGDEVAMVTVALVADTGNGCVRMVGPALNISAVAANMVQGAMSHVPFHVRFAHVCSVTGPRGVPLGTQLPDDVAAAKLGTSLSAEHQGGNAEHAHSSPSHGRTLPTQAMRAGKVQLLSPPKAGYCDGASLSAQFRAPTDLAVLPYAAFTGFPGQRSEEGVPDASEYAPPVVVVCDRDNQLLRVLLPGWALTDDPPAPLASSVKKCLAAKSAGSPQKQLGVQARVPGHVVPARTGPSSMAVFVQQAVSSGGAGSVQLSQRTSPVKPSSQGSRVEPSRRAADTKGVKGGSIRSIPSHMWVPHVARRDKKPYSGYKPEEDDTVAKNKRSMRPPPNSSYYASKVSPIKGKGVKGGPKQLLTEPLSSPTARQSEAKRHVAGVEPPSPPMTLEALSQAPLEDLSPPLQDLSPPPSEVASGSAGTEDSAPHVAPPPPPAHPKPTVSFSAVEPAAKQLTARPGQRSKGVQGGSVARPPAAAPSTPQPSAAPRSAVAGRSARAGGDMNALDALALANDLVDSSMAGGGVQEGGLGAAGTQSIVSAAMTASSRRGGGRGGASAARAVRQMAADFSVDRLGATYETLQEEKRIKRKAALQRALANGPRPGVRDDSGISAVRVAGLLGAQSSGSGGLSGALAAAAHRESGQSPDVHGDDASSDGGFEYEQMLGSRVSGRSGGVVYAAALGSHLDEEAAEARQREQYEALVNALPADFMQEAGAAAPAAEVGVLEQLEGAAPGGTNSHGTSGVGAAAPAGLTQSTTFVVHGTERYLRPTKAYQRHKVPSPASATRQRKEREYQEYRAQRKAKLRLKETEEKRPWAC